MTKDEAASMANLIVGLFPLTTPDGKPRSCLTPELRSQYEAVFMPYTAELCRAAIEGYARETKRRVPVLGELRARLLAMAETAKVRPHQAESKRNYADDARRSEQDDADTRAWLATMSDAEIERIAAHAIASGMTWLGIFGADIASDSPATRANHRRRTCKPDASRIRAHPFARGMLRAYAAAHPEACRPAPVADGSEDAWGEV